MRKYKIVTGGAGFIGSHLCDALVKNGHHVICIDNLVTGSTYNIKHLLHNKLFTFIQADVCKNNIIKLIKSKVAKLYIDEIYYLASIASPKLYIRYPIQTITTNVYGLQNFLDIAKIYNTKLIYTSTSEVYGDPVISPQSESYTGNVDPNGNRAVYDESKRLGETLVTTYHTMYTSNVRIIRIFNTYGPRMHPNDGRVIPTFIQQSLQNNPITIFGDGAQTRSFCYITDLVSGILSISNIDYSQPINLGNPNAYYSVLQIAQIIKELTHSQSEIVHSKCIFMHDPKIRRPDISTAKKLFDWSPKVSIPIGLTHTIKYIRQILETK